VVSDKKANMHIGITTGDSGADRGVRSTKYTNKTRAYVIDDLGSFRTLFALALESSAGRQCRIKVLLSSLGPGILSQNQ
jgi:hypothetical protein